MCGLLNLLSARKEVMIIKSASINTGEALVQWIVIILWFHSKHPPPRLKGFLRGYALNCEITRKGHTTWASLNLDLDPG